MNFNNQQRLHSHSRVRKQTNYVVNTTQLRAIPKRTSKFEAAVGSASLDGLLLRKFCLGDMVAPDDTDTKGVPETILALVVMKDVVATEDAAVVVIADDVEWMASDKPLPMGVADECK